MGRAVEVLALERGHDVVARFNTEQPLSAAEDGSALHGADVVIDFSLPALALGHIKQYCRWNQNAVVGTTGWYEGLEYDVAVHEAHHTGKADSPSGTALLLSRVLLDGLSRKTHLETETQHQPIDPHALHVTSSRRGSVFGEHTVYLDSPFDAMAFSHQAKNRKGFAFGALKAAEWLPGRQGLFTLDDLLRGV